MADENKYPKGRLVIHENNLADFLSLLKVVLDKNYQSSHRRTKVVEVDNWTIDTNEALYYYDISHGFDNMQVDVRGYTLNTPIDSLTLAVRVIDNNTTRVYSRDDTPATLILYELHTSVKTNLRVEEDYNFPSHQSMWTSRATKNYIDNQVTEVVDAYLDSDTILNNSLFMERVINSVLDEIDVYGAISDYTDNKFNSINANIVNIKKSMSNLENRIDGMSNIEERVNTAVDNKVQSLNLATKAELSSYVNTMEQSIMEHVYQYIDQDIGSVETSLNNLRIDVQTNYAKKSDVSISIDTLKSSINTTLENYAKKSDIAGLIPGDYATKEELTNAVNDIDTKLNSYVTSVNLDTILEVYAKKSDIAGLIPGDYATKEELTNIVDNINTKFDDYVTSANLDMTLEGYAKKSDISGLIPGDYVTKTELDDFHTTLIAEVDDMIQNFEAVRAMTQDDINNAIDSVLH